MNKLFCLGAGALMLCACSEMSNPQVSSEVSEDSRSVNVISSTTISDPAQDPYTVENMSKALRKAALAKSLTAQDSAEVEALDLEPNFLHVRFLCKGKEGVAALKAHDASLVLFKHPLDYKPVDKSIVYKDSSLPEDVIPMFATVPVDYNFGSTEYDVVKELFLVEPLDQDDDEDGRALLKRANGLTKMTSNKMIDLGVSLNEVEWTSLEMTGNLETRLGSNKDEIGDRSKLGWSLGGGGKRLGGTLKFKDVGNKKDEVQPLEGVRVTGGYSYYWREAHTDANGKFSIPEKWNFSIDFEVNFNTDDFVLEDGGSIYGEDLEIERNGKYSDWNETFTGNKAKWSLVWTAAYQAWYHGLNGYYRPRGNVDIVVNYDSDASNVRAPYDGYYKLDRMLDVTSIKKTCFHADDPNDGYYGQTNVCDYKVNFGYPDEEIRLNVKNRNPAQIFATTMSQIAISGYVWNKLVEEQSISKSNLDRFNNSLGDELRRGYAIDVGNSLAYSRYGTKPLTKK